MSRVIWSQDVKLALERIYHFLAIRDKVLAKRALSKIYQGAKMLDAQPLLGHSLPNTRPAGRELLVRFGRGGYLLRYIIENDRVVILGVRHSRQLPP